MLKVENLSKHYSEFDLSDVSFELEKGYILGFIGRNGAGKSTTIKSILNMVTPTSGTVEIFGKDFKDNELELKERIGYMLGEVNYYPKVKIKVIANVYKKFFKHWDEDAYKKYLTRFNLSENKRIEELSSGMKVKLGLTFALSHGAELFIFDEPTSGLDPIARDELLDLFQEIVSDGDKSILFSTHITSDLDKCADYILFIKDGKIVANSTKDDLINSHLIVKGGLDELNDEVASTFIGVKKNRFGFSALVKKEDFNAKSGFKTELPNLEDIMVYYNKEEA